MEKSSRFKVQGSIFWLLILGSWIFNLVFPSPSLAQSPNPLCADAAGNLTGVNTAIGCLQAGTPNTFIGQILGWAVIVGGGIAFLLIAFAGFQIATAAGDPKRVQAARELLTSAISGLLLILFSIFLLNLIGIRLLDLNKLGLPFPNP